MNTEYQNNENVQFQELLISEHSADADAQESQKIGSQHGRKFTVLTSDEQDDLSHPSEKNIGNEKVSALIEKFNQAIPKGKGEGQPGVVLGNSFSKRATRINLDGGNTARIALKMEMVSRKSLKKIQDNASSEDTSQQSIRQLSDQVQEPLLYSQKSVENPSASTEFLKSTTSGMDKVFYLPAIPEDGSVHMGFLDCRADVKVRELRAYEELAQALQETTVRIPRIIDDTDKPGPDVEEKSGKTRMGQGYWIEAIENMKSFKPISAAYSDQTGRSNNPATIYRKLIEAQKNDEAQRLKDGIAVIFENCSKICEIVGELTLGINAQTGEVFLVDVAPTPQGQTARDQLIQIEQGLRRLLTRME